MTRPQDTVEVRLLPPCGLNQVEGSGRRTPYPRTKRKPLFTGIAYYTTPVLPRQALLALFC